MDRGSLRTRCDERGGLLVYTQEKFGASQIRSVYRSGKPQSNAGVFVRIDDGILSKIGENLAPRGSPQLSPMKFLHRDRDLL